MNISPKQQLSRFYLLVNKSIACAIDNIYRWLSVDGSVHNHEAGGDDNENDDGSFDSSHDHTLLTHLPRVPRVCVGKSGQQWFR